MAIHKFNPFNYIKKLVEVGVPYPQALVMAECLYQIREQIYARD
jgi:hypothetical protein